MPRDCRRFSAILDLLWQWQLYLDNLSYSEVIVWCVEQVVEGVIELLGIGPVAMSETGIVWRYQLTKIRRARDSIGPWS
jgi:hypothetical protein